MNGQFQLGKIDVAGGLSTLGFGGPAVVRFVDSHQDVLGSEGSLSVENWNGSTNGGGTHQFYVGMSGQGLTRAQLDRISFSNPAGLPAGTYIARILSTGEIVPAKRPSIM